MIVPLPYNCHQVPSTPIYIPDLTAQTPYPVTLYLSSYKYSVELEQEKLLQYGVCEYGADWVSIGLGDVSHVFHTPAMIGLF